MVTAAAQRGLRSDGLPTPVGAVRLGRLPAAGSHRATPRARTRRVRIPRVRYPQGSSWSQPPAAWGTAAGASYWTQADTEYRKGRSWLAIIAGLLLLFAGVISIVVAIGLLVVGTQGVSILDQVPNVTTDQLDLMRNNAGTITASGGAVLVVALLELIAAVGIFGHRGWGRWLGVLLGIVGVLAGMAAIIAANQAASGDVITLNGSTIDTRDNMSPSIGFLVFYAIIFFGLLLGGGHFRVKEVEPAA